MMWYGSFEWTFIEWTTAMIMTTITSHYVDWWNSTTLIISTVQSWVSLILYFSFLVAGILNSTPAVDTNADEFNASIVTVELALFTTNWTSGDVAPCPLVDIKTFKKLAGNFVWISSANKSVFALTTLLISSTCIWN